MTHAPAARYKVDSTRFSTVAVCLVPGCGSRWLAANYQQGLVLLADHIATVHHGYENCARARARAESRRRARGAA